MKSYLVAMSVGLMSASVVLAIPSEEPSTLQSANRLLERQHDAQAFIREVNDTLVMAREGTYGSIKEADLRRLNDAEQTIVNLLRNASSSLELSDDDRIEVYNAQEEITAILRNDEKNRIVCERIKQVGTRVAKRECMTVAEREERIRAARDTARKMTHEACVKTDHLSAGGNRCHNRIF